MSRDYVLEPFGAPAGPQIDYARELNPQQHAAVIAAGGPSLVLAGAGAGKTRTLIYRVAYLLEQGIPPERILLLTFTNKAAREMMGRVTDLLGSDLTELWGGTFHSIGHRFLRRHADLIGARKDFTILDREDSKDLIKACFGEADLAGEGLPKGALPPELAETVIDSLATRYPKPEVLGDIISLAVNTRESISNILAQQYSHFTTLAPQIQALAARYQARKRASNVLDFDDLLIGWLQLLQASPDIREQYQRRFQFLLVDEYQDTNKIQAEIIDLLAERHQNLMVVGDDSQSIYSWRGANFQNILEFPKRYPRAQIFKIEINYRSTPQILAVANAAIKPNLHQFGKELAPERAEGSKPVVVICEEANDQAAFVAQRMLQLREEGAHLNKMAVLYRSHFHALELQLALTRRNIPFSITSGIRFFEQAHLKDLIAYLKLVTNPRDELAFKRIAQMLPGVGGKSAEKLWNCFQEKFQTLEPQTKTPLAEVLQTCSGSVPKKALKSWTQQAITVSQLEGVRARPDQMIRIVIEAGYEEYLEKNYSNPRNRLEELEQLANFAHQFPTTEEFLTQLALLSNLEAEGDKPAPRDDERVRLSTIHQAKGLEFDIVFIIMLCDGFFPSARSLTKAENEEEERRLFYVAITRARDELYLSYPLCRFNAHSGGNAMQQPSRFLREIPPELIEEWNLRPYGRG